MVRKKGKEKERERKKEEIKNLGKSSQFYILGKKWLIVKCFVKKFRDGSRDQKKKKKN